jgi:hypothetical protein
MKYIKPFNSFIIESENRDWNDKRRGPHPYDRGLTKKEEEEKEEQMKDQAKMADDDPNAYKEMPGDKEAREKGEVKTSKHVKSYHELYGDEDEKNEALIKELNLRSSGIKSFLKQLSINPSLIDKLGFKKMKDVLIYIQGGGIEDWDELRDEAEQLGMVIEAEENDMSPIDDEKVEKALKKKEEETGVPVKFLRIVMRRGMAAWRTGHRPGAGVHQWGYARVNSFLTKQEGTWDGADKDVAQMVKDGGFDKDLKKA